MQIRPIDQTHPWTRHQNNHISDLLKPRKSTLPLHKSLPHLLRDRVTYYRREQIREEKTRGDSVHADAVVAGFKGGRFGDAEDSVLRCRVGLAAGEGHDGVDGGTVYYCAALRDTALFSIYISLSISFPKTISSAGVLYTRFSQRDWIGALTLQYSPASSSASTHVLSIGIHRCSLHPCISAIPPGTDPRLVRGDRARLQNCCFSCE